MQTSQAARLADDNTTMVESYEFLRQVLDRVAEEIVVIDSGGNIQFVNDSWSEFGRNNACLIQDSWRGVNYLQECDKAAAMGDEFGIKAAEGLRAVIAAEQKLFYLEYPCHSPQESRWFMMRVAPFQVEGEDHFVISHLNITERKLAEDEVLNLSRIDGLTDIPNRRYFDTFLQDEWQRCARLQMPISLALIDLDHFKLLNDHYGHPAGDDCLRRVSAALKQLAQRPSDLCARYGGEEFAIIYGNTSREQAANLALQLLDRLRALKIPNEPSPCLPMLTASVGVTSCIPGPDAAPAELIEAADRQLYLAKNNGRNQISVAPAGKD